MTSREMRAIALKAALLIGALGLLSLLAPASARATEEPTVTRAYDLVLNGRRLSYSSTAGRVPIRVAGTDVVRARMFYVAYRVTPRPGETRPLTVIWNGGPGGSMLSILLGGQGPRRIETGRVIDNPDTLLDVTDLLYLDAVGSGFSRATSRNDQPAFYQTRGDVDAFVEGILAWRRLHDAGDRPIFLAGVSWGAYRVAAVAHALATRGVTVGGGAMMAGRNGLARPGAEARYLPLGIVHYPRVARLHGRGVVTSVSEVEQIEREARNWADAAYLPALARLPTLSANEREAIAGRLARYSGLPLASIDRATLVVTPRQFTAGLLADRGLSLAPFDLRQASGGRPAAPRRVRSPGERYLREDLGYRTSLAYLPLVWDAARLEGFLPDGAPPPEWDYLTGYYADTLDRGGRDQANRAAEAQGYPPGGQEVPLAEQAMRIDPSMRFLVIHGRFDALPSSCTSVEAQLREIDPALRTRVTFRCVESGHALFVGDPMVLQEINAELRALIAPRTPVSAG